jgi:hypothetical protein
MVPAVQRREVGFSLHLKLERAIADLYLKIMAGPIGAENLARRQTGGD